MSNTNEMFKHISYQLDKIDNRLDNIEIVQAQQAKDIEHHISRTDQLQDLFSKLQSAVSELMKNKYQILGAAKLVGSVSLIVGILKAIQSLH